MSQARELREIAGRLRRLADDLDEREQTLRYIAAQAKRPNPCEFQTAFSEMEAEHA